MADDRCQSLQGTSTCIRRERREPGYGPHKRGLNTKLHLAVDAFGMPVRVFITEGTRADCKEAVRLIEDIPAEYLLADRWYDTDEIIEFAEKNGMIVVIPSKKNRKEQRPYDKDLYKLRHLVENAFLKLKQWRGIALDTPKMRHLFWLQSRFVASRFGCKSSLNSCRHHLMKC